MNVYNIRYVVRANNFDCYSLDMGSILRIWGHQEFVTNFPCNLPPVNYVLALACLKMKYLPRKWYILTSYTCLIRNARHVELLVFFFAVALSTCTVSLHQ